MENIGWKENQIVKLIFEGIDIENHLTCAYDYLEVKIIGPKGSCDIFLQLSVCRPS